jgi:hypothetical protein
MYVRSRHRAHAVGRDDLNFSARTQVRGVNGAYNHPYLSVIFGR